MSRVFEFFKRSWLVPAILCLFVALVLVKKFDFSLTDHIANKVIQKLDADYSPYGPNDKPVDGMPDPD